MNWIELNETEKSSTNNFFVLSPQLSPTHTLWCQRMKENVGFKMKRNNRNLLTLSLFEGCRNLSLLSRSHIHPLRFVSKWYFGESLRHVNPFRACLAICIIGCKVVLFSVSTWYLKKLANKWLSMRVCLWTKNYSRPLLIFLQLERAFSILLPCLLSL